LRHCEMADDLDEPQMINYSSYSNISFHGSRDSGYTKREWRYASHEERETVLEEVLWDLVELWPVDSDEPIDECPECKHQCESAEDCKELAESDEYSD
jgi:hypothetical protein